MIVSEFKLYELLKAKIGERDAEAVIQILENEEGSKLLEKYSIVATQADIAKMIDNVLDTISKAKTDIIKWMVAIAIAIVSLIVAFIKYI